MRCKALKPTSDSRLQDFLGTLQSFEAYLRFQPALIFPLAASRQLRRALTIRYRDSSVDSNIPGTSLDQGGSSHVKILSAEIEIEPPRESSSPVPARWVLNPDGNAAAMLPFWLARKLAILPGSRRVVPCCCVIVPRTTGASIPSSDPVAPWPIPVNLPIAPASAF